MSDNKLLQNTLAEATTESGFPTKINTPLQREVTLETGETVIVEGITPDKMKAALNQNIQEGGVTFLTPGENYNEDIKGVCQVWNDSLEPTPVEDDIVIKSNKTVTVDFYNLAANLRESLRTYMEEEITSLACESYPIIEIKGKDTNSTIEFYIAETGTTVLVKLGYKTGEDTGSSIQIASIDNTGSQPGYVMGNLGDVFGAIQDSGAEPVTIDVSSIGAGVSTFLKESTPLTVTTIDSGEISNVTIDLKDYVTVS